MVKQGASARCSQADFEFADLMLITEKAKTPTIFSQAKTLVVGVFSFSENIHARTIARV